MDVTVTRRYRERQAGVGVSDYSYSKTTVNNPTPPTISPGVIEPEIISFTDTNSPAVDNYDTKYFSIFGPYPKVILLVQNDDDENELESQHVPKREKTDGVLTKIIWDLGDSDEDKRSGIIILYK